MWWLVGLISALAAAHNSRGSVVGGASSSSEIPSGTLIYRSRDGRAFFRFRLTPLGADIRIHILVFPNLSTGSCHVLHDSDGPYICWSGAIRSTAAAKTVAAMWAEATLVYQRTGRVF